MIKIRKSKDRGFADHGWLKSHHTFSFADYYDPECMGFSVLRVINEDRIKGGTGFGTHPHRDMEIVSYVISGALEHKDSMGNATIIYPGEVQRMSAGTGIKHSEFNYDKNNESHFLQIWILPDQEGIPPSYDQKNFKSQLAGSGLVLVASKTGRENSVSINQDVEIYAAKSEQSGDVKIENIRHRNVWVQVIKGKLTVENLNLEAGDGAAIKDVESIQLKWIAGSEFIVFNLPQ